MSARNNSAQTRPNPPAGGPRFFGHGPGPGHRPPGSGEKAKSALRACRRMLRYLRPRRATLVVCGVLAGATTGLAALGPYLIGQAIDRGVLAGDLARLKWLCLILLAAQTANAGLQWIQSYLLAGVAQGSIRDIRQELFARLQVLPLGFFDRRQSGELLSRLTNDVDSLSQLLAEGLFMLIFSFLGLLVTAGVMFWLSPALAAVTVGVICALTLGLNLWLGPKMGAGFRRQQAALGELSGLIEETVTAQAVVKAYGREADTIERFGAANREYRDAALRAQLLGGFTGPLMNFVNNLGLATLAAVGGWLALGGRTTVGTLASFVNYARHFGRPLNELAQLYASVQSALAGAERVFAIIDEPAEADPPDAAPLPPLQGEVVFEKVGFSYVPGTPVLREIDLHARPGQMVALVGPTGAGKTTLVNLLARFYDYAEGRILIDGRELGTVARTDLRRQLGAVPQDTFLFAATVAENIRYGRLEATDAEVAAAARLANAEPFILRLPQGYATPLTARGGNLSQGQRQLLAIARAILADPRILILDEATSSVDMLTERHIQEAMRRLLAGRTSFVIAHRLSTIRDADQILVIDQGRIVESGRHEELLAGGGLYSRLYANQFEPEEELVDETAD